MNPISSTTQMAPWSDIASGRRMAENFHWLKLPGASSASQLALSNWSFGERLFSGQPYHYWRSFKADAEYCWSNGTHSFGSAWFSGSLLNMDDITIWFSLTFAASNPCNILRCDITVVIGERGGRGNGVFFIDGLGWVGSRERSVGLGWVTKTGPMSMSVKGC